MICYGVLKVRRCGGSTTTSEDSHALVYAKDYVKSLHQNTRSALLYGKNNVIVQPVRRPFPLRCYAPFSIIYFSFSSFFSSSSSLLPISASSSSLVPLLSSLLSFLFLPSLPFLFPSA